MNGCLASKRILRKMFVCVSVSVRVCMRVCVCAGVCVCGLVGVMEHHMGRNRLLRHFDRELSSSSSSLILDLFFSLEILLNHYFMNTIIS